MTTPTRTLSRAIATAFAIAAVAIPVTPAAAEPKHDVPLVTAAATGPSAGEVKNEPPFVTTTSARSSTRLSQPTSVERIIAQERGRQGDPRIFGPSESAPVQIVQVPGGFDWGNAGIGGAATLALALLAAGGMALRHESRRQSVHG
jgi:hypothetical protein